MSDFENDKFLICQNFEFVRILNHFKFKSRLEMSPSKAFYHMSWQSMYLMVTVKYLPKFLKFSNSTESLNVQPEVLSQASPTQYCEAPLFTA